MMKSIGYKVQGRLHSTNKIYPRIRMLPHFPSPPYKLESTKGGYEHKEFHMSLRTLGESNSEPGGSELVIEEHQIQVVQV